MSPSNNILKDLKLVHVMVEADFMTANAFLKKYFLNATAFDGNIPDEVASRVGKIITALQHMDVVIQRLANLIAIHQEIITEGADLKRPFYHLHFFQVLTMELNFVKAVITIKGLIDELKIYMVSALLIQLPEKNLFMHASCIKQTLENMLKVFTSEGGDIELLPALPFTIEQIQTLQYIYTTESERFVLNWFLNSVPMGTAFELLLCYESQMVKVEGNEIEFF
jgi:hypothetical protein